MDQMVFRSDTVLSDVHLLLPNRGHLMVHLNVAGQPVFASRFKILRDCKTQDFGHGSTTAEQEEKTSHASGELGRDEKKMERGEEEEGNNLEAQRSPKVPLDEDGDLDVVRRPAERVPTELCLRNRDIMYPTILSRTEPDATEEEQVEEEECPRDVIKIEHTMATPLEDVGKQVWRGGLLLADFILSQLEMFRGATVLELGAGTGLTSLVMAMVAKRVYCTDVGHDLLTMCQRNIMLNTHLLDSGEGEVKVRELDWLWDDFCTDTNSEFGWSEEEVADLHDNATVLFAADAVCYDDNLTDSLFRTLYRISSNLCNPGTIYLCIEKRLNFTIRHLNVTCEAYDYFRHSLDNLQDLVDGKMRFTVEQLETCFPQFLQYERVDQLELWKVTASHL
ncbi:methyltransferase-like protein 22 isoform X3 [Scleropages formosus]|uniref:methyltransferase-like protein 22 isoform X3 n=1 Tax=Scleropages formosus TaxID=113540 RepID=UPI000878BDEC|nr:methyltransferase-like protein 22 isoform X3 [Scleropages formosus]